MALCGSSAWCFSVRQCVPLRPLWPPVPPTSRALPPLCALLVCAPVLPLFFFFLVLCSRSLLLPRALRVPSALLRATLIPLPCAPSLACLPSHSPSRCRPCLHVCPPCPCSAVTRVCHSRALPLPLPLAPTLFPGCSLGPRLSPHPGCLAACVGGGVGVSVVWRRLPNSRRCICIVEPGHQGLGWSTPLSMALKVLPWVVVGAGGLGAGKTSGAGTRGISLDVVIGVGTGYTNTNGGESSDNRGKVHADCGPAENPSL